MEDVLQSLPEAGLREVMIRQDIHIVNESTPLFLGRGVDDVSFQVLWEFAELRFSRQGTRRARRSWLSIIARHLSKTGERVAF
jgi:hypothetical protein